MSQIDSSVPNNTLAAQREGEANPWLGGSGVRLTPSQKQRIKASCLKRDGSRCKICLREEADPERNLEIDHIDGNAANHHASNLRLVHHSCNSKEWNRKFWGIQRPSDHCKSGRGLLASSPVLPPTSPEVRLNREYEPHFRKFCFQKVKESISSGKPISRNDLRIEARNYVGCSQQTSYSYMERLLAPNGPFVDREDAFAGIFYVAFKDYRDQNLTLVALESKFPKEGQRVSQNPEMK